MKVDKNNSEITLNTKDYSVNKKTSKKNLILDNIEESPEKNNKKITESKSSKNLENFKMNPDSVQSNCEKTNDFEVRITLKKNNLRSNKERTYRELIKPSSNVVLEKCYSKNCDCSSHRYCEICYQFFIKNDFCHIKFVIDCEVYKSFFNNSKSLEDPKELENKEKNSRLNNKVTSNCEIIFGNG